ncbi:MAG: hypothetical protein JXA46_17030 [Dehalococcoidales bacterium]|nr:hypothetical protein [Dehalococcoidales bacterium]
MIKKKLSMGLDLSTQSISAVVLDIDSRNIVLEHCLDYVKDARLNGFGIRRQDYILPPASKGEAGQPPEMYFAALDSLFSDTKKILDLKDIAVINTSAQQHGHVYLNRKAPALFAELRREISKTSSLVKLLDGCLSYRKAPVWMTSNTKKQAEFLIRCLGGKEKLIDISGSDAQLRFTGLVMRRTAEQFPREYENTGTVQLISSLVPSILTGDARAPVDFGNACGMCLMDYNRKQWSEELIRILSNGLPGGVRALRDKLPLIVAPDTIMGTIASYFVYKYGFSPQCAIAAGSGDNPQSMVLVNGDLLSLGSSFVIMSCTDGSVRDTSGAACAMYDGIGRPFMFGCRTNGAMVWDSLRIFYGLGKNDYVPAEKALEHTKPGECLVLWQPNNESFPLSGSYDLVRTGDTLSGLVTDYPGLVESSLSAVYLHSRTFSKESGEPLFVTGGASRSHGVLRRISAIWQRPVVPVERAGAALGAAIAGAGAFLKAKNINPDLESFTADILRRGEIIYPYPGDIAAFHRPGGYLSRFAIEEEKLIRLHSLSLTG